MLAKKESVRIMINIIEHTEELPIIGIGRRINGVKKTTNNRHRCFNQLMLSIIITKLDRVCIFNHLMCMKEWHTNTFNSIVES